MAGPSSAAATNGTAAAAGKGGPAANPALYARRQQMNEASMTYYAIGLSGLMAVFILFHLSRVFARKTGLAAKFCGLSSPFVYVSRVVRNLLIRKVPAFTSAGHATLATIYAGLNLVILFTNMDTSVMKLHSVIAARTGWMAVSNVCVVVFLSLKNTPLGFLTAWSYERLNVLHQIAGYTTFATVVIHGCSYASYFGMDNNLARLRVNEEIFGMVAGFSVLTMFVAGAIVRRFYYELFYMIHVSFFVVLIVFIGLHQPEMYKRIVYGVIVAGSMWLCDRSIRFLRVSLYAINNTATIHPLSNGGTKIVLKKAPIGAKSGEHCFLWIPKVRAFEMHPFTVAAMNPLEFVVASYDGFTRDLHQYATKNPGAVLRASVEGSYGTLPDTMAFDKVVMIAGGSGASFSIGMALHMLKRMKPDMKKNITFIWMVKDQGYFSWFSKHLATIRDGPDTSIQLYVTRPAPPGQTELQLAPLDTSLDIGALNFSYSSDSSPPSPIASDDEKKTLTREIGRPPRVKTRGLHVDLEKHMTLDSELSPISPVQEHETVVYPAAHVQGIQINRSRPDVSTLIREAVSSATPEQRVLVMACGPVSLMTEVRNTTARCIRPKGPAVELHCEQFGW